MADYQKRKNESIRRANRVIQSRTMIIMIIMGVVTFALLFIKLYQLMIVQHDELQEKAISQQTSTSVMTASRGTIYDKNGNILAISASARTIFISPMEIDEAMNDSDQEYTWTKNDLAAKLSELLEVNEESILQKMEKTDSQYEVIKLRADEDVAAKVQAYVDENDVKGVYFVEDSKRYYPYDSLAAQIIGFVGDENTGLYGLEAQYEEELEGHSGLEISATDTAGNDLMNDYGQYFAAENGNDLILTLDTTVQYYLEQGIKSMVDKYQPSNGATGIVLDVNSGAVLAMASYPNYDPNNYLEVTDSILKAQVEDGSMTLGEAQLKQWRNKAINDTYEPGSTYKILTLASALEEGVVNSDTTYTCQGQIHVLDKYIRCTSTHGLQTLRECAAHSCNPAFITFGMGLGQETYMEYMNAFNMVNGSGIDLAGEATGIYKDVDDMSILDLACYAFGQNCNVTPIALIAAQAACVNGGYLYQPYVVDRVVDSDGNVVYQHDTTPIRQVVSEETSAVVRECLEYVVSSGTGKNGSVSGYRIGGKTGTADKGKTGEVVVSFVCFAPADDPEVIMLITMDSPTTNYSNASGGGLVAPVSSQVMSEILPYLGVESSYSAKDLLGSDATVPNVIGMSVADAENKLNDRGFTYRVVGSGDTITDQTPAGGSIVPRKSTIVLYAGTEKPTDLCTVPNLVNYSAQEASTICSNAGLLIRFSGVTQSNLSTIKVLSQSIEAGQQVEAGTVIDVQLGDTAVLD